MSEEFIEQKIQEKNLNAPRLSPASIEAVIVGEEYHRFEGTTTIICLLTLKNGYTVVGESACVSMDNFDEDIGRGVAKESARNKIWALEGYLLKDHIVNEANRTQPIETTTYAERIIAERDELYQKSQRLEIFMITPEFESLADKQRQLMNEQYNVMIAYVSVLEDRLRDFPASEMPQGNSDVSVLGTPEDVEGILTEFQRSQGTQDTQDGVKGDFSYGAEGSDADAADDGKFH